MAAPVGYGASTSLVSFAALLFSAMPGVRELAFFSLSGLSLALILALVVLPCLIGQESAPAGEAPRLPPKPLLTPWQALVLVALVLAAGAYWGGSVRFDSDLRSLSASGLDIKQDEAMMHSVWGSMQDRTMVFAQGASLDDALAANRDFFDQASGKSDTTGLISLAPILPPRQVQAADVARWRALFTPEQVAGLRAVVASEAASLGFTPDAFDPFWNALDDAAPARATPARLRAIGLGEAVDLLLASDASGSLAISLMSDNAGVIAVGESLPAGVRVVSRNTFARELTTAVRSDFARFILLALGGNLVLLYIFLRSVRSTLLSLLPSAVGLALLFGAMGALAADLNLFGVIAIPLVIGIGVDYGIFMALQGGRDGTAMRAVVVAGLSTIVGFGALALARHPALHSIGLTVLIGISGSVLASCLFVVPLGRRR